MARIKHIDGLRAVAIIAVVLYHAFPKNFPNGYIGVDYFLVISGFLISKKYFIDPSKKFCFNEFWSKRILRIYPQLLTCLLLCLPIAWFTMQSNQLENFSQSSIATLLGLNNVLLYLSGGYWSISNEFKPFFNTWSLGLEEQFYFLASIGISFFKNFKISKDIQKRIFFTLFLISLITSGFGAIFFQKANYLLLLSRFWEFGIGIYGAFLAKKNLNWITNQVTNICLLSIVIFSLGIPIETSKYAPNPLISIPLIGVLIICISKNKSISINLLSSELFVYIGLSSYAIYLYHQPLLAFARLYSFNGLKNSILFFIVLGSFLIGFLMYELIERRLIFFNFIKKNISIFKSKTLFLVSGILLLLNFQIYLNQGFFILKFPYLLVDGKPPEGFLGGKLYTDKPNIYLEKKFPNYKSYSKNKKEIDLLNILLVGDSHTRDLINTFEIIDLRNSEIAFNYSYHSSLIGEKQKQIFDEADIIIIQVENKKSDFEISKKLIIKYNDFLDKIIWFKSREIFAENVTPAIFKKELSQRANFTIDNNDSYYCNQNEVISTNFEPKDNGLAIIDSQCAFNNKNGKKILTSNNGELYTFDGIHLSYAGAERLANILTKSEIFNKFFSL